MVDATFYKISPVISNTCAHVPPILHQASKEEALGFGLVCKALWHYARDGSAIYLSFKPVGMYRKSTSQQHNEQIEQQQVQEFEGLLERLRFLHSGAEELEELTYAYARAEEPRRLETTQRFKDYLGRLPELTQNESAPLYDWQRFDLEELLRQIQQKTMPPQTA